ncbi:MAG: class B sortase [Huintestinicola sp.]
MSMSDEVRTAQKPPKTKAKKSSQSFFPKKGDSSSEIISKIIVLVSILALIVCGIILAVYFYQIYEAKQNNVKIKYIYEQAQQQITVEQESPIQDIPAADDSAPAEERPPLTMLPAAVEMLSINPDSVGLVNIPGCVYEPVVQYTDNDYYLNHNIYGSQRQCGTCFADYRNIVGGYDQSDNIILYAHNQKDGTMFGNLDYYRWDYAYWLKNPIIYFNTNYSEDAYVIISSFVINTLPEHDNGTPIFDYHNYINFDSDKYTYDNFISEITKRSTIITGVDVNENDKFLTLSTCSTEWEPSRHVLVARKLRDGETPENLDTTKFEKNPNPKWPAIYYKYNGGTYIE